MTMNPAYWFIGGVPADHELSGDAGFRDVSITPFVTAVLMVCKIKFMRMMERDIRDCI